MISKNTIDALMEYSSALADCRRPIGVENSDSLNLQKKSHACRAYNLIDKKEKNYFLQIFPNVYKSIARLAGECEY